MINSKVSEQLVTCSVVWVPSVYLRLKTAIYLSVSLLCEYIVAIRTEGI